MRVAATSISAITLLVAMLAAAPCARAQDCARCTAAGEAADALPGLSEVPVAELRPEISGAITIAGGYGLSIDEPWAGSTRHRLFGSIAGAIHLQPWLAIGASMRGRWESIQRENTDTGLIGIPTLSARLTVEPIERLGLALDVAAWMHGSEAPSLEPASTSMRARAIGSYRALLGVGTSLVLTAALGGILDNSRAAAPRAITDALSDADRLSLGVSDFSGVLVGLGGALRLDAVELIAEASYRILAGDGAPPAAAIPLHIVLGARVRPFGEWIELGVYADVLASEARADQIERGRPASPIDPRIALFTTASLRLGVGREAELADEQGEGRRSDDEDPSDEVPPPASVGSLSGRVLDHTGEPIAGASIEVVPASAAPEAEPLRASTDVDGRWSIAAVPPGPARIVVRVEGRDPIEQSVEVLAGEALDAPDARIARALPQGEIRGVIQGANGAPIAAQIRIDPLGLELECDADGAFEAEVPPGHYRVIVRAPGHRAQTREVEVVERGVVVLNAQLHRQR